MTTTVTASLPAQVNLNAYYGDTWTQSFRFLSGDQPADLTGLELKAAARGTTGIIHPLIATTSDTPTDGTILISLAEPMDADLYDYDIQAANPDGTTTTIVAGHLRMHQDVTP